MAPHQAVPIADAPSSSSAKHSAFAKNIKLLNCGIFSGLIQAGVFNPWDRALYLSVMHHRPFLRAENFVNPMAGVMQTITQRAISSGLYFPLEDIFSEWLTKQNMNIEKPHSQRTINFVAGLLAGSINGLILNPLSSVKVSRSRLHNHLSPIPFIYSALLFLAVLLLGQGRVWKGKLF